MAGAYPPGLLDPMRGDGRTLSSYNPSLREKTTDWLRGLLYTDDRAGQDKAEYLNRVAETMIPPYALAAGVNDVTNSTARGDYGSAAFQAALMGLPGAGRFRGYKGMHPYNSAGEVVDLTKGRAQHAWSTQEDNAGFFASNPEVASYFAKALSREGAVFPATIEFKNPLVIDGGGRKAADFQFGKNADKWKSYFSAPEYAGHDGVILTNVEDAGGVTDIYIPKTPAQIAHSLTGDK